MKHCFAAVSLIAMTFGVSAPAMAQTNFGGQGGADMSLEAISPEAEALQTGMAGSDPADIARYLLARGAGGAAMSPDGTAIAFRYSVTGTPQLWTVPISGGQPTQLTFGNGITFFRWVPDGSGLVYGADNNGNEQESYFLIESDGSVERELLPAVEGGFRAIGDFSGDGTMLAFASTEHNGLDFDIYLADAATGETRRVYEGKYGNYVQAVSPDASRLVISQTVGEDADNIYLLDTESGERTVISAPEPRANHTDGNIVWSADGKSLYFASNRNREFAALTRYDLEDGTFKTLTEGEADVENVNLCGRGDKHLVYTTNHDGFDTLHVRSPKSTSQKKVSGLPGGVYGLSCGDNSDDLVVRVSSWERPGDLYRVNLRNGKTVRVFASTMAGLESDRLVKPESMRMPARDGVELQGLLYVPDEASRFADKPPVVFIVHGGPTAQARPSYNGSIQYLVDQGIAVFASNVRGSTGFGRTYTTLDDREKRLDSVRDLVDMLAGLEADGRVDASRAAVVGGSYGGYAVNAVLAAYPDAFKAGVSLFGVADWVTALEVASPALKASDLIEYGDINDQEWKEFYTKNSPIRQADNIRVPVLFSHGMMDPRIDIAETEIMVKTLRKNGIEAPFIRIPDEGHGWRKLKNQLFYNRRQAEFLLEQLGE